MGKHLQTFLDGIAQVLVLWPEDDYIIPRRGDFRKDADALRQDVAQVGKNLRKALNDNVKIDPRQP